MDYFLVELDAASMLASTKPRLKAKQALKYGLPHTEMTRGGRAQPEALSPQTRHFHYLYPGRVSGKAYLGVDSSGISLRPKPNLPNP